MLEPFKDYGHHMLQHNTINDLLFSPGLFADSLLLIDCNRVVLQILSSFVTCLGYDLFMLYGFINTLLAHLYRLLIILTNVPTTYEATTNISMTTTKVIDNLAKNVNQCSGKNVYQNAMAEP